MTEQARTKYNLAIVEDDRALRDELADFFLHYGYAVHKTMSLDGLQRILSHTDIHLVLLDINLPQHSGFEIAEVLRQQKPDIGLIMLTGRTQLEDRVHGYELGADVYMQKPVAPQELLAVVASMTRRMRLIPKPDWLLDIVYNRLVHHTSNVVIHLNPLETAILSELMQSSERQLSFEELLRLIQEHFPDRASTRRSLENVMSRLRQKTMTVYGDNGQTPLIKSVRNVGYQLTCPLQLSASSEK